MSHDLQPLAEKVAALPDQMRLLGIDDSLIQQFANLCTSTAQALNRCA